MVAKEAEERINMINPGRFAIVVTILWCDGTAIADTDVVECDLYIADSTIPKAGLGIFSSIPRNVGDTVGDGDVCIPIIDVNWFHGEDMFNPYSDYVWAGEEQGMLMESNSFDIEAMCPGLDCAINCHAALVNVGHSAPKHDTGGLYRSKHPGAGAITPYHNGTTVVTRKIPSGGELFKYYGDNWFTSRPVFDSLPLEDDFDKAESLLANFGRVIVGQSSISQKILVELYEQVILPIRDVWNSRTINAIPQSYEEVLVALETDIREIHQPNATRSLSWLQQHGKCIDHIVPAPSTIKGAGRGAFAKRNLPNGTIITGSPFHHIPFREAFMEIYDNENETVIGQQLLLNYCFGHEETSMLLCPYGSGVNYINHQPGGQANIELVWAKDGSTGQDDSWFGKSPTDFLQAQTSRLALDYVATRDISEGEELFLDYGDAWQRAWVEHSKNWEPEHPSQARAYLNGRDWNTLFGAMPLRTHEEMIFDPYPTTLTIRCHSDLVETKPTSWKRKVIWHWQTSEYGYPCRILDRRYGRNEKKANVHTERNHFYTVEVTTEVVSRFDDFEDPYVMQFSDVPRDAIRFFDKPYSTDIHLRKAFRHEIGLPDKLVPNAWRNVRKPETTEEL